MEYCADIGLDVHKDTIAVAYAPSGRREPVSLGVIVDNRRSLRRLMERLRPDGEVLGFCDEAGRCGSGIWRETAVVGHACMVVPPSPVPRRPGDRVKTDRRGAPALTRLLRSGDLTAVREDEAMRDLIRAREDLKGTELRARQRLGAFLLRHGRIYRGGRKHVHVRRPDSPLPRQACVNRAGSWPTGPGGSGTGADLRNPTTAVC